MEISKKQIDALNAIISIGIEKKDYQSNVEKALNNYRKNASIPGFRKGAVPMSLVQKQYGKAVQADEINKLLQNELYKYLAEQKINTLGQPLPIEKTINWDDEKLNFEFEIGLVPEFEVNLKPTTPIRYFNLQVNDTLIDQQVERLRKQFGSLVSQEKISQEAEITAFFFNENEKIDATYTFMAKNLQEEAYAKLENAKVGEQITLPAQLIFTDAHQLMHALNVPHEVVHHLNADITITIDEINTREMCLMNEEFFAKLAPNGEITSEADLRQRIKEDAQKQYDEQAAQQLLNDASEYLLESTKFDLPSAFLQKWLRVAGEKPLTEEEAQAEYNRSERGLRYQLIEEKITKDHGLVVDGNEITNFAKENIRLQMKQFGIAEPDEKQISDIVKRVFKNEEEINRIHRDLVGKKLVTFFKEHLPLEIKNVTFDEFIEQVYDHK